MNRMKPLRSALLASTLLAAASANAQGLPAAIPRLPVPVVETLARPLDRTLGALREVRVDRLLHQHRRLLDTDRDGALVVRGRVVALDPSAAALSNARAAGFIVEADSPLADLGLRLVVLAAPRGMRTRAALQRLRRLDPEGHYEFDHVYLGADAEPRTDLAQAFARQAGTVTAGTHASSPVRVGLVDSGVQAAHPSLRNVDLRQWGCSGGPHPDAHGTAVASLLAGAPADATAAPGGMRNALFAADIYCGAPTGGAVTGLAQALAWLSRERVAVINLSVVGPPNALLERLVESMLQRGHVLVAAVGNDGPAAPPLYPAAYDGVIGITAVDARGRILPEAARGRHVDFAAPGADLHAAENGAGFKRVRGTSFAAPLVARRAATTVRMPASGATASVTALLARDAVDAGPAGRDPGYGAGLLASDEQARWSRR